MFLKRQYLLWLSIFKHIWKKYVTKKLQNDFLAKMPRSSISEDCWCFFFFDKKVILWLICPQSVIEKFFHLRGNRKKIDIVQSNPLGKTWIILMYSLFLKIKDISKFCSQMAYIFRLFHILKFMHWFNFEIWYGSTH